MMLKGIWQENTLYVFQENYMNIFLIRHDIILKSYNLINIIEWLLNLEEQYTKIITLFD